MTEPLTLVQVAGTCDISSTACKIEHITVDVRDNPMIIKISMMHETNRRLAFSPIQNQAHPVLRLFPFEEINPKNQLYCMWWSWSRTLQNMSIHRTPCMSDAPPTSRTITIIMNATPATLTPTRFGRLLFKWFFSMCLTVLRMYFVIRSPTVFSTPKFKGIPIKAQKIQKSRPTNEGGRLVQIL